MALEIERKFLLAHLPELDEAAATDIVQAYLRADREASVRVRITDDQAWITIKGPVQGRKRNEYEYPVPEQDAREMLSLAVGAVIEKRRYSLQQNGYEWVIDVFRGPNTGLRLAEVELPSEDADLKLPAWVGEEVTADPRYLNASLCRNPFNEWSPVSGRGDPP
jgi:CYTH domain-containing protein